jgi:hypothetical protein
VILARKATTSGAKNGHYCFFVTKMLRTYAMQRNCKEKKRSRTGVTAPGPAAYVQQSSPDGIGVWEHGFALRHHQHLSNVHGQAQLCRQSNEAAAWTTEESGFDARHGQTCISLLHRALTACGAHPGIGTLTNHFNLVPSLTE